MVCVPPPITMRLRAAIYVLLVSDSRPTIAQGTPPIQMLLTRTSIGDYSFLFSLSSQATDAVQPLQTSRCTSPTCTGSKAQPLRRVLVCCAWKFPLLSQTNIHEKWTKQRHCTDFAVQLLNARLLMRSPQTNILVLATYYCILRSHPTANKRTLQSSYKTSKVVERSPQMHGFKTAYLNEFCCPPK